MKLRRLRFDEKGFENYTFRWVSPNNAYLISLRKKYKLDSLVSGAKNELDVAKKLCVWTSKQWKHNGTNRAQKTDPISILEEAKKGSRFRCTEYGIVLRAGLNSLGLYSRSLGLMRENIESAYDGGHSVVETYLESYGKWIMLDPQWGITPLLDGVPVSAVELQGAIAENIDGLYFYGCGKKSQAKYRDWIFPYLFFFRVRLNNRLSISFNERRKCIILTPLGYKAPKTFGGRVAMKTSTGTHSLKTFYQKP